ncbi:SGNH/GDSL hydrolase family protein [Coraliomargarita algicola]|uniref:SGNH/GDSL hydrolase family protein n=1 Tax=Coraliomargarita algicola TaxID=3092156 RepID=A0ABZ0RJA1_9BACT|nr:SGNH/GDSL hydrolase family protein [Coraliomargarita sp. J2-16]WPJ95553.1 SGNH/GDSL hydrolase family protein [Coraliomargarita sp. J2-16]
MRIDEIDSNFRSQQIGDEVIHFLDARKAPFVVEGFPWSRTDQALYRLPPHFTKNEVNEGQLRLAHHTSGGVVRFATDARYIALRASLHENCDMDHMPRTGSMGFDLYRGHGADSIHVATVKPQRDQIQIEQIIVGNEAGMQEWLLHLPLYSGVDSLEIGVSPDAMIKEPMPHRIEAPVAFYGSSITQGACASRPGNAYPAMLCREMDVELINLGFAGAAHGEMSLAEAISELQLSAFVMDYDHNPATVEPLRATHEPFFKIIRERQPDLPILLISRCDFWDYKNTEACRERREVIRRTWRHANACGDQNVYFIDGEQLFGDRHRPWCTVDTCHPNDLGFYKIFEHVLPILKQALSNHSY